MVNREAEFHLFAIPLGFWVFLFAGDYLSFKVGYLGV